MSCFSTVSSSLTCTMERNVPFDSSRPSLSPSALSPSLSVYLFSFSHIPPLFVLSPLNPPSLDSCVSSISHLYCFSFCFLARSFFSLFLSLSSAFSYFLHKLLFSPLRSSSFLLHLAGLCSPLYSSSSSAAASELS